jgi:hypothetical protein
MEEQLLPPPLQVQLITLTTKIDDSFEENGDVEDDIHEKIVRGIFLEVDERKIIVSLCYLHKFLQIPILGGVVRVMSQRKLRKLKDAIFFFFFFFLIFQVGVYGVGQYLPIFSIEKKG